MQLPNVSVPGFDLRVLLAAEATDDERALMHALFDTNYRQANHPYLDKSFGVLRYAAVAMDGDRPAGFALGDTRVADLPRLPQQAVAMAGICCVAPEYRRRGLFGALEQAAMRAAATAPPSDPGGVRILGAGRMAHPASMRTMTRQRSAVPRLDTPLTEWQRTVGRAVAALYGTAEFDDETFVCKGSGAPIGYPVIELQVEPDEWRLFEPVDRDRGDSLLGMGWIPDPPPGWDDPD